MPKSNIDKIYNLIDQGRIKVISFDIFDTLLIRPCILPADLFNIIAKRIEYRDYTSLRQKAEKAARAKLTNYFGDVTLDEIYNEIKSADLPHGLDVNKLADVEKEVELQYLKPRNAIREIYEYALSKGLKVVITSDMYLTKDFVVKALHKNGYKQYEGIYLSSDQNLTKASGMLFNKILYDYRKYASPEEILHIGDNYHSDVMRAASHNLKAIHIQNKMYKMERIKELRDMINSNTRTDNPFLIGAYAHFFEENICDSQCNKEKTVLNALFSMLYAIFPLRDSFDRHKEKFATKYVKGYEQLDEFICEILYSEVSSNQRFRHIVYRLDEVTLLKAQIEQFNLWFKELFYDDINQLSFDAFAIYHVIIALFYRTSKHRIEIKKAHITDGKSLIYVRLLSFADKIGIKPMLKRIYFQAKNIVSSVRQKGQNNLEHFAVISKEIGKVNTDDQKHTILFFGDNPDFDKGSCQIINRIYDAVKNDVNFVFINEGHKRSKAEVEQLIECSTLSMPMELSKNYYEPYKKYPFDSAIATSIEKDEALDIAYKNFCGMHYDADLNQAKIKIYYTFQFICRLLDTNKPSMVILWNQFHWLNGLIDRMCKQRCVKTMYLEFGVLPGTFCIEKTGQMGASWVAKNPQQFLDITVNESEIAQAKSTIHNLFESQLNRNIFRRYTMSFNDIEKKIDVSKPIIFFAGQNDYESGIFPYTDDANRDHSPIFTSSNEAMVYLAHLATIHDWNLIYKPHPSIYETCIRNLLEKPENVVIVNDIDINSLIDNSDVVVTILSQVSYLSLIRNKPVLMLGYNQLRGKKCTYEAYRKTDIVGRIETALANGYTQVQTEAFALHVAQLRKTYLMDGDTGQNGGRSVEDVIYGADGISAYVKSSV